jgi:hypothetical protein
MSSDARSCPATVIVEGVDAPISVVHHSRDSEPRD